MSVLLCVCDLGVCVFVCGRVFCVCVYLCVSVCVCVCLCFVFVFMSVCVFLCVCLYVCFLYVSAFVCLCVHKFCIWAHGAIFVVSNNPNINENRLHSDINSAECYYNRWQPYISTIISLFIPTNMSPRQNHT